MEERLQKILRDMLGISRRDAEKVIAEGKVTVNGKLAKLGDKATPEDDVRVAGKSMNKPAKYVPKRYYLVYKPVGYTSSTEDEHAERLVTSLVAQEKGLMLAGRLDVPSEGLMLLTDDGDLVYKLTHPKFEVPKEYEVTIEGHITESEVFQLTKGIRDDGDLLIMKKATVIKIEKKVTIIKCVLTEGKKREIRRMFDSMGKDVLKLCRVKIGPFQLGSLTPGQVMQLSERDVRRMMQEFLQTR
jgi:pseudouridine synthase